MQKTASASAQAKRTARPLACRLPALAERFCSRWELLTLTLLIPLIIVLAMANLGDYPTISGWDEGIFLQFADNLVHHGDLAARNGDNFERASCSVGPTVMLPIAGALWMSGNSLAAARLVIAFYLLLALVGAYLLVRYIGGWPAAIAAVFLFLTAGYTTYDTLWVGRQVLGEVPAFAFLLFGLWAWLKSHHGSSRWLIIGSVLLGLAVITKGQLILILGPSFVLLGLLDRVYYRQLRWTHSVAPIAAIVISYVVWWSLLSTWIVNPELRASYLEGQSAIMVVTFLHVNLYRWVGNLKFLYRSEQWPIALIAITWGLLRSRQRTLEDLRRLVLPLFAGVALVGFLGLGLPWARYLYPTLALAALSAALFVGDLVRWAQTRWKLTNVMAAAALALAIAILAAPRLVQNVQRIVTTHDASAERFAALVEQMTPPGSTVLNWEWEIEFYSQRSFLHPPSQLHRALLDYFYNQRYSSILDEPRFPEEADYLITGPFASQTQLFTAAVAQQHPQLLVSEGPYQLYQLQEGAK
jgi:4-amino-4-deoxy-L-arabinose transferase-like glycosyltransferase